MRCMYVIAAILVVGAGGFMADAEPKTLEEPMFQPLPLGAIRPTGWLKDQLTIQRNGLTGHLDEFWPDIKNSGWIGGEAEGWERAPYWLDGLVPLAYALDDSELKAKAERWMNYILEHQAEDGWFGPQHGERDGKVSKRQYDPWPTFILLKAMIPYYEATGDQRVVPALLRYAHRLQGVLAEHPLFEWGQYRWMDGVLCLHWFYGETGEVWLLDVAQMLHDQGFDWAGHFRPFTYTDKIAKGQAALKTHVVNNAMALKSGPVWYRQSGDPSDAQLANDMLAALDQYHGQVTGIFAGDEHYAGKNPSQGTELCAVVEFMYSLEMAAGILGDPVLADRLERVAFNALPATFKPDMWAHQYDQQVNQPIASVVDEPIYTTNGPDSNIFGLAPNYGCCTSNMHQGWPKLVQHLWMTTADGGLAALVYGPCVVDTTLHGKPVHIEADTQYPFREDIVIRVTCPERVRFPLQLRVPAWATGATLTVDGAEEPVHAGQFHRLERDWEGTAVLAL